MEKMIDTVFSTWFELPGSHLQLLELEWLNYFWTEWAGNFSVISGRIAIDERANWIYATVRLMHCEWLWAYGLNKVITGAHKHWEMTSDHHLVITVVWDQTSRLFIWWRHIASNNVDVRCVPAQTGNYRQVLGWSDVMFYFSRRLCAFRKLVLLLILIII